MRVSVMELGRFTGGHEDRRWQTGLKPTMPNYPPPRIGKAIKEGRKWLNYRKCFNH